MKKTTLFFLVAAWPVFAFGEGIVVNNWPGRYTVTQPDGSQFHASIDNTVNVAGSLTVAASTTPTSCMINGSSNTVSVSNFPLTYPVTGSFWQTTQPVSGSIGVNNFPSSQTVYVSNPTTTTISGTVPVSGTFWQNTQPISGSVSVSNFPASQAVTGSFYQSIQPVSGTVGVSNSSFSVTGSTVNINVNGTVPVSGTFWPAIQPVSQSGLLSCSISGSSNTVQIAGTVPVSGAFYQTTQPVSIASMPSTPVTGTFWQNTQPVSIASMPSTPVTGTFWQATQPVSGSLSVSNFPATQPVSIASMPSTPVTGSFWQNVQPVYVNNPTTSTITGTVTTTEQSTTLIVSSAVAAGIQLSTGPAGVSGQFHYISMIEIVMYATAARNGSAAPITCTSSNLPGNPAWTFPTAQAIGTEVPVVYSFAATVKSSVSGASTLVTCPATTSVIWRVNIYYRTGP